MLVRAVLYEAQCNVRKAVYLDDVWADGEMCREL